MVIKVSNCSVADNNHYVTEASDIQYKGERAIIIDGVDQVKFSRKVTDIEGDTLYWLFQSDDGITKLTILND